MNTKADSFLFFNRLVSPSLFEVERNVLSTLGFLKSASIRSVFFPLFAKTIARFAETVDFPSSGPAEVTTIVFIS